MIAKKTIKKILLIPVVLFALFYLVGVYMVQTDDRVVEPRNTDVSVAKRIALFGGSGTTGDGILKASLASPEIEHIYVVTRRVTPRMTEGVESGKVTVIEHMDYLNYESIIDQMKAIDTVYWAIGISSIGVDEKTYGMIHTDFPVAFLESWNTVSSEGERSFHFISSSDISEDSDTMWIREKIRAEKALFGLAENTALKVIAYRPDYIGPTEEEAHLGQDMLYWFFAPVGAAVKAQQIGQAMIEVTARIDEFSNKDKLSTLTIIRYSDAYERLYQP